ncbi:hypothetical protein, partial [Streptomyces sp. NPDC001139]
MLGAAVVAIGSETVRFFAERTRAHQWALAAAHDGVDQQALHSALQTINTIFHRAAWTNARHGAATMDTLVSVGTL